MNTNQLLSAARFCYARLDDNDVNRIERHENEGQPGEMRVFTADGVVYCVPDQDVKIEFDSKNVLVLPTLRAFMLGRPPENREVFVSLELQHLSPVTSTNLLTYGTQARVDPLVPVRSAL